MPVFTYKGTNKAGATVTGERNATSKAELQASLKRENIAVKKVSEKGKEFNIPSFGGNKVSDKELAVFLWSSALRFWPASRRTSPFKRCSPAPAHPWKAAPRFPQR
jgi:hypothetical protein